MLVRKTSQKSFWPGCCCCCDIMSVTIVNFAFIWWRCGELNKRQDNFSEASLKLFDFEFS